MEHPLSQLHRPEAPLPDRVAQEIARLIRERTFAPGDKLPNEFALCGMLGVGRGSVREAVKLLVARNVLEIQRGRGTFVSHRVGEMDDPLGFAFYPDQEALAGDLLEVRTALEPWVAGAAARRATPEDMEAIRQNAGRVEAAIRGGENHLPADADFHLSIARCTQNLVVSKLLPVITYSVGLFGRLTRMSLLEATIQDHRRIVEAIGAGDAQAASAAMQAHMEHNRALLERDPAE